jgi:drug/metabolite transporter (DMT)-like permease
MPRLALLLSTFIWGATFPATKAALEQLPPFSFLFVRFFIGLVITLALFGLLSWSWRRDRRLLRMSVIATVYLFLGYTTQTVGLQYTTASNSAFITALYVVFVPMLMRRFDRTTWVCVLLATAGLWLLVNPSMMVNVGDLLSLACAVAFAGHIACLESYARRCDPRSLFLWQLLFITGMMIPAMLMEGPRSSQFALTAMLAVALTVTGVLATGAFAIQVWVQRRLPAQQVALIFSLEPAYAAWLAWYFLGEQLSMEGMIGSGLILAAVIVGALASSRQEMPVSPIPGPTPA